MPRNGRFKRFLQTATMGAGVFFMFRPRKQGAFPARTWDWILGRSRKWFVSHAYQDAGTIDVLRSEMPHTAELVIFPPIEVSPREAVSTELLSSIRSCHGLIFIDSPRSIGIGSMIS